MRFEDTLKGQRIEAAERVARASGYVIRVLTDETPIEVTRLEYDASRVNVRVKKGVIVDARVG